MTPEYPKYETTQVIVNICDSFAHPVARYFDRTALAQSTGFSSKSITRENKRNLAKPGDSLSIMISNGKENVETLLQKFNTYFTKKYSHPKIANALE